MTTNFVQPGDAVEVTFSSPAEVESGDGLLISDLFGVAANDAASGENVTLHTTGVWTLPKAAEGIAIGNKIYWDAGNSVVTKTASSHKAIGHAVSAAESGDATVKVRLTGASGF